MDKGLITKVQSEEQIAIAKWGHVDRNSGDLLAALLEKEFADKHSSKKEGAR